MEKTWKHAESKSKNNYNKNYGQTWNPFPPGTRAILTRRLSALINKTAANLRRPGGKSVNNIKRNFEAQYRNIEAGVRENAEFFTRKNKSPAKSPRSVRRPPLAPRSPRAAAVRNKLVSNLQAEHAKLVKARNYYQREANKLQSKINAIVTSHQRR